MSRVSSNDPDDDFAVEITSLDAPDAPIHAPDSLLQGSRLAPRVRTWLIILSVVSGLLLIFVVLSPILSSLLPKKTSASPTSHLPPTQTEDVTVQNGVAYINSSDGIFRALSLKNGSLLWQRKLPDVTPFFVKNIMYVYYYDQQFYTVQALRASDGTLLWTFKTSSSDSIPVVIDDGVAYALSISPYNEGLQQSQALMALDAGTGGELWRYNINAPSSSNISVQGMQDKIYITASSNDQTQNMDLFVLRSSDGLPLWHYNSPHIHKSTSFNSPAYFSLPLTPNGLVYITSDGSLLALNADNGHEVWHYKSANQQNSISMTGTRHFYVQTMQGSLQAFSADNETLAWSYQDPEGIAALFPEVDNVLYIKTSDGFIVALRTSDGKRLWRVRPIAPPFAFDSVMVQGNIVYTFALIGTAGATIVALDVSNGVRLWQRKVEMGNSMAPTQISDDQLLIDSGSTVTAFRGQDGMVSWHVNNVEADLQYGMPLDVEGDVAILRLYTGVIEVRQVKTGAVLWRYPR